MQTALLGLFLALSLTLIFLGYYSKERSYSLVGFAFIFILGFWGVLLTGIQYQSGQTEVYNYICQSCTGTTFPSPAGNESQISSIVTTYDFTTLNDNIIRFIGIWLTVIGGVGIAINIAEIKRGFA